MKFRVLETFYTIGNTILVLRGKPDIPFLDGMEIEDENRVPHHVLSTKVETEEYMVLPEGETTLLLVSGIFQGRKVVIPGEKKKIFPSFPVLK